MIGKLTRVAVRRLLSIDTSDHLSNTLVQTTAASWAAAAGFLFGYAIIRLPFQEEYVGAPASAWLFVAGVAFGLFGTITVLVALARPARDFDQRGVPRSDLTRSTFRMLLPFSAGMLATAIASPHSGSHRWIPAYFSIGLAAFMTYELRQFRREQESDRTNE